MNMPKVAVTVGILLILQGVGFYFASASRSPTALIPAVAGLLILISGLIGFQDAWRKHALHGAVMVALLGMLAPIVRMAMAGVSLSLAGISQLIMLVLCGGFLILGIKSFRDARRRQREAE
jgi:hypothetical protein